jgi:hypothetical protein
MKKSILVLLILVLLLALIPIGMAQAKKPFRATTTHTFVGTVVDGRFIFWEGEITGDIEGTIRWWGDPGGLQVTGQASHYDMFLEIVKIDEFGNEHVLLAGEDSGTTTARHGKNSNWRTNGIVTYADEDFASWLGRHVHQSGHFWWTAGGAPEAGTSIFRIN